MRGKVLDRQIFLIKCRITPAYAGKSSTLDRIRLSRLGSPPPMRGKDFQPCYPCGGIGITPAYAGKSFCVSGVEVRKRDHPRLCGEKETTNTSSMTTTGITPTYAGKREVIYGFKHVLQDHPRLCGEKIWNIKASCGKWGSPPPMRGKARKRPTGKRLEGITPAYAGKRVMLSPDPVLLRDHPRLCGEKCTQKSLILYVIGSPPPMRGKVCILLPAGANHRITPAYAGKRRCISHGRRSI